MNITRRIKQLVQTFGLVGVILLIPVNHAGAQELSMGWEDWQPYQYKDSNQVVTGLDVELMQAIFNNMSYRIALTELP